MKSYPAIAIIEFSDVPTGVHTLDVMIKKAPISTVKSGTISQGRYLILIGGSTASVEESYNEALFVAKDRMLDHLFLPDVHPQLHDGIFEQTRTTCEGEAMAVLETQTVSRIIHSAEKALKGTDVSLVEIRLADPLLNGKGISVLHGPLYEIEAAVELADFEGLTSRIITAPHESLAEQINANTRFHDAPSIKLEGEDI